MESDERRDRIVGERGRERTPRRGRSRPTSRHDPAATRRGRSTTRPGPSTQSSTAAFGAQNGREDSAERRSTGQQRRELPRIAEHDRPEGGRRRRGCDPRTRCEVGRRSRPWREAPGLKSRPEVDGRARTQHGSTAADLEALRESQRSAWTLETRAGSVPPSRRSTTGSAAVRSRSPTGRGAVEPNCSSSEREDVPPPWVLGSRSRASPRRRWRAAGRGVLRRGGLLPRGSRLQRRHLRPRREPAVRDVHVGERLVLHRVRERARRRQRANAPASSPTIASAPATTSSHGPIRRGRVPC